MSRLRDSCGALTNRLHRAIHGSLFLSVMVAVIGIAVAAFYWMYLEEHVIDYPDERDHFKYGSIGGDDAEGIPQAIWEALPELFVDYLPDPAAFKKLPVATRTYLDGYRQFGFVIEDGRPLPVGFSQRRVGVTRIGLNCAVCHTSTVKITEGMDPARIYGVDWNGPQVGLQKDRVVLLGIPAQTFDIQEYIKFLVKCGQDARFTTPNLLAYLNKNPKVGFVDRLIYRLSVPTVRTGLINRSEQFAFFDKTPQFGPGRIDTFNPYKRLQFRFPYDGSVGTADFPSIWNQGSRVGMRIHWDGNNDSVFERNITAAFGAGARPVSLDQDRLIRLMRWCGASDPRIKLTPEETKRHIAEARAHPFPKPGQMPVPGFPFPVNPALVSAGRKVYDQNCASCHAWSGDLVGKVTPQALVKTDPFRCDSFSSDLATNFSTLGLEQWWAFSRYSRTLSYANMPLDGIWARAPYLHNGSVPTLADLLNHECSPEDLKSLELDATGSADGLSAEELEPTRVAEIVAKARALGRRPPVFYRGDDEYDSERVGFRVDRAVNDDKRKHFLYDTRLRGNGNSGHWYGVSLSLEEKAALLEYLKTLGGQSQ